jgi:hypothetical protein
MTPAYPVGLIAEIVALFGTVLALFANTLKNLVIFTAKSYQSAVLASRLALHRKQPL